MQDLINTCVGLVTQFNPLNVAKGALLRADNAVIRRENIIENRRGYALRFALTANINSLMSYQNRVIYQYGTKVGYDTAGVGADYSGAYSPPTSERMRSAEVNSNLMVTTDDGIKVFTDASGTAARSAGAPRALDPSYALNAAGAGFLATSYQCAYRALIERTDANLNLLLGYPSQRLWVSNTAGTGKNIDLTLYLPSECIAGDVIKFFRTVQVSGTTTDTSGDEMGLVYRHTLTAAEIVTGNITFTDITVDALIGETLYTSPSQQGIAQGNERPPLAKDMALYNSAYMLYANTKTKQRLAFSLIATGALSGKYVTIDGINYNFGASEIVSGGGSPQALVSATGTVAVDIDLTARSLVRVINRYASNTGIYAYYTSGPEDLPGQIMLEARALSKAAFSIASQDTTIAANLFPAPPVSPATSTASMSSNSVQISGLYWSKDSEFEAVPAINFKPVGSSNKAILRVVALRDSAIIIKEEGVYRLTGQTPDSFVVSPVDLTVFCKGKDSVSVLANQVFMLSNQGVVAISDNGAQVISREIEPSVLPLLTYMNTAANTVGEGYESERLYMLSTVSQDTDTVANQTFVYNILTKAWTRWTFGFNAAIVEPSTDKLFFTVPSSQKLYIERKDFEDTDYADPEYTGSITAIGTATATFSLAVTPEVGWMLFQGSTGLNITAVTINPDSTFTVTLDRDVPATWVLGSCTVFPGVKLDIGWIPWTASNPGALKQVRAVKAILDPITGNSTATSVDITFETDFDSDRDAITVTSNNFAWGTGPWGEFPWGGTGGVGFPTWVTREKQYCGMFFPGVVHRNAQERIAVSAFSLTYEIASDQTAR